MATTANKDLVNALSECIVACNHCAASCLAEDDVKKLTACIGLDMDCADICTLVLTLTARNSPHGRHLLKECIEVCTACAKECSIHAKMGMEHCRACAAACTACADACKQMAA